MLSELDDATRLLVQLAAHVAGSPDAALRAAFGEAAVRVPQEWVEELVVQSHLFSGFPRALNAAREWRRVAPSPAPHDEESAGEVDAVRAAMWRARGEATCAAVYGPMYDRLRVNIGELHPALDVAMVVEGYGRVLGRPGLDLARRELCIVAACAAAGQDRQLHSHLHGALNVGVPPAVLSAAVESLEQVVGAERVRAVRLLLARVLGK